MKFGFSVPLLHDPTDGDPYRRTYELAALGEEQGFDFVLLGHHSFTPETGDASAPFMVLAALAARTTRIRLGTGIFLLPLHHPVAVAEQIASLDRISGGRAILGVGVGYRPYEYEGFGVPFEERGARMTEQLQLIKQAWTTGEVGFDGRYYSVPRLPLEPMPVQDPHPPIWVGAVARRALRRAARYGDVWLSDMMQTMAVEQRMVGRLREYATEAGRDPSVCIMRMACVAESRAQVEEHWLDGAIATYKMYWDAGARGRDDEGIYQKIEHGERVALDDFARDRVIAGTPDDCIEQIRHWQEGTGCDHMHLAIGGTGDGDDALARSLRLFGEEVLPAFAD